MIGTRLQETQPGYDKRQDTITINWGNNQQTQRGEIFQQVGLNLEIQQCQNQGRR